MQSPDFTSKCNILFGVLFVDVYELISCVQDLFFIMDEPLLANIESIFQHICNKLAF